MFGMVVNRNLPWTPFFKNLFDQPDISHQMQITGKWCVLRKWEDLRFLRQISMPFIPNAESPAVYYLSRQYTPASMWFSCTCMYAHEGLRTNTKIQMFNLQAIFVFVVVQSRRSSRKILYSVFHQGSIKIYKDTGPGFQIVGQRLFQMDKKMGHRFFQRTIDGASTFSEGKL